jgi:transketolase
MSAHDIDDLCTATIRALSMDAVQQANSGHPGMPMGMADVALVLWTRFLKYDPGDPSWPDRDRFVLSAGHGSMLLYSLLHLTGYDLPLEALRNFRQWESATPGHPEYGDTPGVECTTGPLGQGLAMAVGMAIGEARLRQEFGADRIDHRVYVIAGDGCMMEGLSSEAASLAGHLSLDRLVVLYDDNRITIDGSTDLAFTEDVGARYRAYGWHVSDVDGHDRGAVGDAIEAANRVQDRPSLISCKTTIGKFSPNLAGSQKTHGAPLGEAEVALTKQAMDLDPTQHFHIPAEVYGRLRARNPQLRAANELWRARMEDPLGQRLLGRLQPDLNKVIGTVQWPKQPVGASLATRKGSHKTIQAIARELPGLIGGSADLEGSNGTRIVDSAHIQAGDFGGRNLYYGVREHAMAAIANGLALHGGHLPFVGTFLIFHDYMRPAVRLSALMGQHVVYVYTHDSVLLGEDGPTHQPVETLEALRGVPNLVTIRPCDLAEVSAAWQVALVRTGGPTALCLTRQSVPELARDEGVTVTSGLTRGAYILQEAGTPLKLVLIATGSEVHVAVAAREMLESQGIGTRVVSMPSCELFDAQTREYQRQMLPAGAAKLSVEAGITKGWARYVGRDGASIGIDRFGASAPASVLANKLGLNAEHIVEVAHQLLGDEL